MKTIDSILLAKYILAKLGPMSHLKLQKLIYYAHAWHLVFTGEPLIDDQFEAWVHGPVSKTLWNKLKKLSILNNEIALDKQHHAEVIQRTENLLNQEQLDIIKDVLDEYGKRSAYHLECLTHSEDPWIRARRGLKEGEAGNSIISNRAIKRFYESRLES